MELRFGVNPLRSDPKKENSKIILKKDSLGLERLSKVPGRFSFRIPKISPTKSEVAAWAARARQQRSLSAGEAPGNPRPWVAKNQETHRIALDTSRVSPPKLTCDSTTLSAPKLASEIQKWTQEASRLAQEDFILPRANNHFKAPRLSIENPKISKTDCKQVKNVETPKLSTETTKPTFDYPKLSLNSPKLSNDTLKLSLDKPKRSFDSLRLSLETPRLPLPSQSQSTPRLTALTRSLHSLQIPAYFRRLPAQHNNNSKFTGQQNNNIKLSCQQDNIKLPNQLNNNNNISSKTELLIHEAGDQNRNQAQNQDQCHDQKQMQEQDQKQKQDEKQDNSQESDEDLVALHMTVGEAPRLYGSILKLPGHIKKRGTIKHVEFPENLVDQEASAREF